MFPGIGRSPPGNIRAKEVSGRLRRSNGILSKVVSRPSSPKASSGTKGWASLWVARALQDSAAQYQYEYSALQAESLNSCTHGREDGGLYAGVKSALLQYVPVQYEYCGQME